jgi:hypothetical protein
MLALTNHFLVYLAALQGGIIILPDKGVYGILGDDIVIANKTIATNYSYIMNDILGVEVNPIQRFSFIPTLISDMRKKEYFKFYNLELKVLTKLSDLSFGRKKDMVS